MRFYPVLRTWTAIVALPLLLGACAFLIPENTSEPRYNTVVGGRRMPTENMRMQSGGTGADSSMSAPIAPVMQQPIGQPEPMNAEPMAQTQQVQTMDLPPVSPQTQQIAQQRVEQSGDRSLMDRMAFWRSDDQTGGRTMPQENAAINNGKYPVLNEVPQAPASTATAQQRLDAVRAELERDRANAGQVRANQAQAAAMDASAPVPPPVYTAPAPAPAVSVPPVNEVRSAPIAPLPPPPSYSPPAYTPPAPMAAAPIQMDTLPMASAPPPGASTTYYPAAPSMEPIQLRPPVAAAPPPAPRSYTAPAPAPSYRAMAPTTSSFDPMAGASYSPTTTAPYYTGNSGYLPPSRYTYRR